MLFLFTGCSGINASGSVSPATFLMPGLGSIEPSPQKRISEAPPFQSPGVLANSF